jgi:hypothetical protein
MTDLEFIGWLAIGCVILAIALYAVIQLFPGD